MSTPILSSLDILDILDELDVREPAFHKLSERNQRILYDASLRTTKGQVIVERAKQRFNQVTLVLDGPTGEFIERTPDIAVTDSIWLRGTTILTGVLGDARVRIAVHKLVEQRVRAARKAHANVA
jgi:hypothetical protein